MTKQEAQEILDKSPNKEALLEKAREMAHAIISLMMEQYPLDKEIAAQLEADFEDKCLEMCLPFIEMNHDLLDKMKILIEQM